MSGIDGSGLSVYHPITVSLQTCEQSSRRTWLRSWTADFGLEREDSEIAYLAVLERCFILC